MKEEEEGKERPHRKFPHDIGVHALASVSMERRVLASMQSHGFADFYVDPHWHRKAREALEEEKRRKKEREEAGIVARDMEEAPVVPTPPCHPLTTPLYERLVSLYRQGHREVKTRCPTCGKSMSLNLTWITREYLS